MPPHAFSIDTRLADALAADELLYVRFTAFSPMFRKLARVLLREDIASQLCLADVASMAGIPAADLLGVANGAELPPVGELPDPVDPPTRPDWLLGDAGDLDGRHHLDVRPLLENGHEPLSEILGKLGALLPGEVLALDATFHPAPLRRLLGSRGYASYAERLAPTHWQVHFRREPASGCGCGRGR